MPVEDLLTSDLTLAGGVVALSLQGGAEPHQLRHAFGSKVVDAGAGIDVVADLLGHAAVSAQVYLHPDTSRLRAAIDAVPSPREQAEVTR